MSNSITKGVYNSAAWRRVRLAAFERDDYRCCRCGCRTGHPTGHHHPPLEYLLRHGLSPYDLDYVYTYCPACHGQEDGRRAHPEKPPKGNRFRRWL